MIERDVCSVDFRLVNRWIQMRHARSSIGHVPSGKIRSSRDAFRALSCLATIISFLGVSEGFAQGTAAKTASAPVAAADSLELSECLPKLKLSEKQQVQVKEITEKYDAAIKSVWQQFGDRYMQTIALESTLMAAVEDTLTEQQRTKIRQQRRKMAQHEKLAASAPEEVKSATPKAIEGVGDELDASGVSLTEEQEELADKIQEKYRPRLRSLNRDIQGLHARLLSLEADKLVSIEKVLTKEQLTQLREIRQTGPAAPKRATPKPEGK